MATTIRRNVVSPGETVLDGNLVVFSGTNGYVIADGGAVSTITAAGLPTASSTRFVLAAATIAGTSISGTVASNGFSLSVGPYLTTAMASNRGSDFVQAAATIAGTNISGTIASNVISLSVDPPGGGGSINFSVAGGAADLDAVVFSNASGVSWGLAGSTITATVKTDYLTTAMASNRGSDFVQANATIAGTSISGTIASNGISLNVGPYITTAMASNRGTDFIQANATIAGTSISGTIASNGISLNVGPYITTGALSNHSHGASAANGAFNFQTLSFSNANGITFATSAGSAIVASVETTYAASNHSHGNPTLALTNLTGTTASASNGFTLSLSAGAAAGQTISEFMPFCDTPPVTNSVLGQSTLYFTPFDVPAAVYASRINFYLSIATTWSGANTRSAFLGAGYALYTRQAGAAMGTLSRLTSYSLSHIILSGNSSTQMLLTLYNGLSNATSHSTLQSALSNATVPAFLSNSVVGYRILALPVNLTLTPGRYWLGFSNQSQSSNGSGVLGQTVLQQHAVTNQIAFRQFATSSAASNAGFYGAYPGLGTYSAVSAAWPNSIPISSDSIRNALVATIPYFNISGYSTSAGIL